jgi:tyrosinase
VKLLDQNIVAWLTSAIVVDGKVIPTNVHKKYQDCLNAPNYTVFSNTTSAAEWNDNLASGTDPVVPLESPHNSIHLAVGGCDIPNYDRSPIEGANGDMGENDTAGLDPIFFFHHCFVDRVFWLWQKRHNCTDHLEIIPGYPGTNSVDSQGPTPGTTPNSWLTWTRRSDPFKKKGARTNAPIRLATASTSKRLWATYAPDRSGAGDFAAARTPRSCASMESTVPPSGDPS